VGVLTVIGIKHLNDISLFRSLKKLMISHMINFCSFVVKYIVAMLSLKKSF